MTTTSKTIDPIRKQDRRIDPEKVPEIFDEFGMWPIRDSWAGAGDRIEGDCGCLAIALLADKRKEKATAISLGRKWDEKGIRNGNAAEKLGRSLRLHKDYILGLIYGWDGDKLELHPSQTEEYRYCFARGHADGLAAARACLLPEKLDKAQLTMFDKFATSEVVMGI